MFCLKKFPKLLFAGIQANRMLGRTDMVRPLRAAHADIIYARLFSTDPDMWSAVQRQESSSETTEGEIIFSVILGFVALISCVGFLASTFGESGKGFMWSSLFISFAFMLPFLLTQWRFYARRWVVRKMDLFPSQKPYEGAPKEILQAMRMRGIEHALSDMSIVLGTERAAEILALLRSGDFNSPEGSEVVGEALEALRGTGKPQLKTLKAA